AINHFPVAIIPRRNFPAGEILAVKQRSEPLRQLVIRSREGDAGREEQPCRHPGCPAIAVHREITSTRKEKRLITKVHNTKRAWEDGDLLAAGDGRGKI